MHILEQIKDLEGQLQYVNSAIDSKDLESWEMKEYSNLRNNYLSEISSLKSHALFMDSEYGMGNW